jgi:hypothetical protein
MYVNNKDVAQLFGGRAVEGGEGSEGKGLQYRNEFSGFLFLFLKPEIEFTDVAFPRKQT